MNKTKKEVLGNPKGLHIVNLEDLGPALKFHRLAKGFKVVDVAKETGISVSSISMLERSKEDDSFSSGMVRKLADMYGLKLFAGIAGTKEDIERILALPEKNQE